MRVPFDVLHGALRRVFEKIGFTADRADRCARLFAEASRDGVASHGLNRVPRFLETIRNGVVDIHAEPRRVAAIGTGALERWDGQRGPGNLNAQRCTNQAIALSREHGIGGVALANTNHWMRAGNYGWQAADAGVIGICWTNTMPNLPPWGAAEARLGNNPLVIAVPRPDGHVVLDMAMSQFSYGALASYRTRGEQLPVVGGFDTSGELTRDPAAIEASWRPLPIGFWKGSGLALMLDLVAALLSGGQATHQLSATPEKETGVSQVFLAVDAASLTAGSSPDAATILVDQVIAHLHAPLRDGGRVRYPGERTLEIRKDSLANGVPVDPPIWEFVQNLQV
jgi:3-dehydro-L-gulonate 2-dehydrogenase